MASNKAVRKSFGALDARIYDEAHDPRSGMCVLAKATRKVLHNVVELAGKTQFSETDAIHINSMKDLVKATTAHMAVGDGHSAALKQKRDRHDFVRTMKVRACDGPHRTPDGTLTFARPVLTTQSKLKTECFFFLSAALILFFLRAPSSLHCIFLPSSL